MNNTSSGILNYTVTLTCKCCYCILKKHVVHSGYCERAQTAPVYRWTCENCFKGTICKTATERFEEVLQPKFKTLDRALPGA